VHGRVYRKLDGMRFLWSGYQGNTYTGKFVFQHMLFFQTIWVYDKVLLPT
jgi:hypothetical protein